MVKEEPNLTIGEGGGGGRWTFKNNPVSLIVLKNKADLNPWESVFVSCKCSHTINLFRERGGLRVYLSNENLIFFFWIFGSKTILKLVGPLSSPQNGSKAIKKGNTMAVPPKTKCN